MRRREKEQEMIRATCSYQLPGESLHDFRLAFNRNSSLKEVTKDAYEVCTYHFHFYAGFKISKNKILTRIFCKFVKVFTIRFWEVSFHDFDLFFQLSSIKVPIEQCRLVTYDRSKNTIECSFEGKDDERISDLLDKVYKRDFFLQIREKDEEFKTHRPGGTVTNKPFVYIVWEKMKILRVRMRYLRTLVLRTSTL